MLLSYAFAFKLSCILNDTEGIEEVIWFYIGEYSIPSAGRILDVVICPFYVGRTDRVGCGVYNLCRETYRVGCGVYNLCRENR